MTGPSLCTDPSIWPAWVQAIGSVVAIFAAVGIATWQRHTALFDARKDDAKRHRDHRRRVASALIAEIEEAIAASARQEETQRNTLALIARARANGVTMKPPGPFNPRAAPVTDAVIYRQAARDIGDFPEIITTSVIRFYSTASEIVRIAEIGGEFETVLNVIVSVAPRLRMSGKMAISYMKRWQEADYRDEASLTLSTEELKTIANEVGYPLEDILREAASAQTATV